MEHSTVAGDAASAPHRFLAETAADVQTPRCGAVAAGPIRALGHSPEGLIQMWLELFDDGMDWDEKWQMIIPQEPRTPRHLLRALDPVAGMSPAEWCK